jgi:NADH:ubiquinone oxidoreductase subunit 2 (subunit N)
MYVVSKERKEISKVLFLVIAIRLLIKIAAAPFYQWLIKITKDISWSQNVILLTWQKLAPVYLLIFQNLHIFIVAIPLSAIIGAILMINKTHLKEIFGLSSLFNLRWIITTIILRMKIYLVFFLIYSTVTRTALFIFWKRNQERLTEKDLNTTRKEITLVTIIRLAGIPPLLGFIIKWMVLEKITQNEIKITPVILLLARAINLYIYLRIINPNLMSDPHDLQKKPKKKNTLTKTAMLAVNVIPLRIICI